MSDLNYAKSKQLIFNAIQRTQGIGFAHKQAQLWNQKPSKNNDVVKHSSYVKATELLEPFKKSLGSAYPALHLLARWSLENSSDHDPAPHLMTTYWTLEEALGSSERTLRRHLVEDGHSWSEAVKQLIDIKHNYGEMLDGKDESGKNKTRGVCVATVIRFFPKGRLSSNARVKMWGRRDLLADSDEGRTRNTRVTLEKRRYQRQNPLMSAYSSINEQSVEHNWLMVKLGQTVSTRVANCNNHGNLYADIPNNYVLHALREDLELSVSQAQEKGMNVKRARSKWVDIAAKLLAHRFNDDQPSLSTESREHISHFDGFTDLWRKLLWTAIRAELYGNTSHGWHLIQRMLSLIQDVKDDPISKPVAYAWTIIKQEGFVELLRDFDTGAVGALQA